MIIDFSDYKFTFGKYKGKPIRDIETSDPQYIFWCHNNIDWFELSDDDLDRILPKANKQAFDWRQAKLSEQSEEEYYYYRRSAEDDWYAYMLGGWDAPWSFD